MSRRYMDGAPVTINGLNFTAVNEPPDEDGHGWFGFTCDTCDASGTTSWAENHECPTCAGCGETMSDFALVVEGRGYCGQTCVDDVSAARHWTAVWSA